jgi:hypothetical protein
MDAFYMHRRLAQGMTIEEIGDVNNYTRQEEHVCATHSIGLMDLVGLIMG